MAENIKLSSTPLVDTPSALKIDRLGLVSALDWTIAGTLALLVVLGFGLRITQLGAVGFAEDEVNKAEVFVNQE